MLTNIDQFEFEKFTFNSRRETLTSIDVTGKYLIKIEIVKNPRKMRDIVGEFQVMKHLNSSECVSCPFAYQLGDISRELLIRKGVDLPEGPNSYKFIIQDFVKSENGYTPSDILFSLIEQKKLGVYQGDVKPENVRFDPSVGICYLIDYDQAEMLDTDQIQMKNSEFMDFCDKRDMEKYGFGNWLRHYKDQDYTKEKVLSLFLNDALDLSKTSVFNMQMTTNTDSGFYHTISTSDVFIHGVRAMDSRSQSLDSTSFFHDERVLDVGCNAGLLCDYLSRRGCQAFGIDNDPHVVVAAKMIANISGRRIGYKCVDLDFVNEIGEYDTVMLFSVFHHTRYPHKNASKIANSCKRIIIETRLCENGKQPINGQWVDTTRWMFDNLADLIGFLEKTFEGFKFSKNLGSADKGRHVLEFIKL